MKNTVVVFLTFVISWPVAALEWIAHRANAYGEIENSIEAINASQKIGVDIIEIDVRVSKDGLVYLFHDDEINGNSIVNLPYAEIVKLTSKKALPKLSIVLSDKSTSNIYLLDFKDPNVKDIEIYSNTLLNAPISANRIILQSDDLAFLQALRQKLPNYRYFYLEQLKRKLPFFLPPSPENILKKLAGLEIEGISIKKRCFLDELYIEQLKSSGLKVYVWTINDFEKAVYYQSIGVDGIITDYVEELRYMIGSKVNLN